jgi:16S rRNA (guanine527-N7)-methyltransferase
LSEQKLRQFAALVEKWSQKINLVSRSDLAVLWDRHVEDSLALRPFIPENTNAAIDLGSGAGFPGLVLAIATGIPFTLIESDKRKAAFLADAARELNAPAKVLAVRIEDAKTTPAPLITARALAPVEKLLGLALPHLAPGGICLFPKGKSAEEELTAAKPLWQMTVTRHPGSAPGSCILEIGDIHHAGRFCS